MILGIVEALKNKGYEFPRPHEEKKEVYWAREVAWCYQHLTETLGADAVRWRDIRDVTNLKRDNFLASYEYLHLFTDDGTANRIKSLLS